MTVERRQESLQLGAPLGRGGEATVFSLRDDSNLVAKIYHHHSAERSAKLEVMVGHPPKEIFSHGRPVIAWPMRRVFHKTSTEQVIGFLMPRVGDGTQLATLHHMKSRLAFNPHFNWRYLVRTAANLSRVVDKVHDAGYVIGDINDSGIIVSPTAIVSLVDCDSFQVRHPSSGRVFRCVVGMESFTPPELIGYSFRDVDRTQSHDAFGLAVLVFHALMGSHPFSVKVAKNQEQPSIADAIKRGLYPDGSMESAFPPFAPPPGILSPAIRQLFRSAFRNTAVNRPTAAAWAQSLDQLETELRTCSRNSNHLYGSYLRDCPWCERVTALGGRDPFPSPEAIARREHLKARPRVCRHFTPHRESPLKPRSGYAGAGPVANTGIAQSAGASGQPLPSGSISSAAQQSSSGSRLAAALGAGGVTAFLAWAWTSSGQANQTDAAVFGLFVGVVVGTWRYKSFDRPGSAPPSRGPTSGPTRASTSGCYQRGKSTQSGSYRSRRRGALYHNAGGASVASGGLVFSALGRTYHRDSCEWARRIHGKNRRVVATVGEALRIGLRPCGACNPPTVSP